MLDTGIGGWEEQALAALAALAWYQPGRAVVVCVALTGVLTGMSIWFAVSPRGKGPTEAIRTVALAAAVAVLGLKRTSVAGVLLLLVVGVVPFLVSSLGRGHVLSSLAAVSLVPIVTGILYLLSARIKGGQPTPSARTNNRPGELTKTA